MITLFLEDKRWNILYSSKQTCHHHKLTDSRKVLFRSYMFYQYQLSRDISKSSHSEPCSQHHSYTHICTQTEFFIRLWVTQIYSGTSWISESTSLSLMLPNHLLIELGAAETLSDLIHEDVRILLKLLNQCSKEPLKRKEILMQQSCIWGTYKKYRYTCYGLFIFDTFSFS